MSKTQSLHCMTQGRFVKCRNALLLRNSRRQIALHMRSASTFNVTKVQPATYLASIGMLLWHARVILPVCSRTWLNQA